MKLVYLAWWDNGYEYAEDRRVILVGVYATRELAETAGQAFHAENVDDLGSISTPQEAHAFVKEEIVHGVDKDPLEQENSDLRDLVIELREELDYIRDNYDLRWGDAE